MGQTRRTVLSLLPAFLLGGCSHSLELPNKLAHSLATNVFPERAPRLKVINLVDAIGRARASLADPAVNDTEVLVAMAPADGCSSIKIARFLRTQLDALDKKLPANEPRVLHSIDDDATITWSGRLNGVNTPFDVMKPEDHVVLALKRTVLGDSDTQQPRVVIYTPYTRHIDVPFMRIKGYEYLVRTIQKAEETLRQYGVRARSFENRYISDVVPLSTVMCLTIIEHVDPSLMGKYTFEELVNRVLVTVAANGSDAYSSAWSSAHARAYGLLQFIQSTYTAIVHDYPEAHLIPNFAEGMRDHVNAASASILLLDHDLSRLPFFKRWFIWWNPKVLDEYLAAMYNSGKAARYMKKYGSRWANKLPTETKLYLIKLNLMRNHLNVREQG